MNIQRRGSKAAFGKNDGRIQIEDSDYERTLIRMGRRRRTGWRRIIPRLVLWTVVGLVAVVTIANVTSFLFTRAAVIQFQEDTEGLGTADYRTRYNELGRQVVTAWYSGGQPPLDLAENVTWPTDIVSAMSQINASPETEDDGQEPDPALDVRSVTLVYATGSEMDQGGYMERLTYHAIVNMIPYHVEISIGVSSIDDSSAVPVLFSAPTIFAANETSISDLSSSPDGDEIDLSDTAMSQIESWAQAWTQDNRAVLKQITQDNDPDSVYVGLPGGWRFVEDSLDVIWAVELGEDDQTVVRVQWEMKVPDTEVPDTSEDAEDGATITIEGPVQTQMMDILVTDVDSGLPGVVAWGASGSGTSLVPYENGIPEESAPGESREDEEDSSTPTTVDLTDPDSPPDPEIDGDTGQVEDGNDEDQDPDSEGSPDDEEED